MTIFNLYFIGILLTFIYLIYAILKGEDIEIFIGKIKLSGWKKFVGVWIVSIMWPVVLFAIIQQVRSGE